MNVVNTVAVKKPIIMEFLTTLHAILMCINCVISSGYSEIPDDDIDTSKQKELKKSLSQDILKLKELEGALEEMIASNDRLTESINASLPVSIKMLSDTDMIDPLEMNITIDDELKRDLRVLFRTTPSIAEDQIGKKDVLNDDVSFADLFTPTVFDVNTLKDINLIESITIDRVRREEGGNNKSSDFDNSNVPSRVKFVDTTVATATRKSTRPMETEGDKLLKFMKEEENSDSDLEEIIDEEEADTRKESAEPSFIESSLKGLPSQYILRVINAQKRASKTMNKTYQSMKGGIVDFVQKLG